jgi:4-hydroxy-tetrahydrodipicolinate synthase
MGLDQKIHGIYPMLYAFFGVDGQLDRGAIVAEVEACIAHGVQGIAVGGLGSECNKLTSAERRVLMEWAAEAVAERVPLSMTIAENSLAGQTEFVRAARDLGASWVVLQPPPVPGASEDELIHFFGSVAEASELPVGIQNAPQFIGIGLSTTGLLTLNGQYPNVSILKAEGPAATHIAPLSAAAGDRFRLFNGRAGIDITDSLRAGCQGIIPGVETCDRQARIYELMASGEEQEADRIFTEILPLLSFLMLGIENFVCYGKRLAARRLGIGNVWDRAPAQAPTDFGLETLGRWSKALQPF